MLTIEDSLRRAAGDDHIKGLLVRLPEGGVAPAAADEVRQAFKQFRAAGKPILAHSQGFYPSGMVTSTYQLAAASGDIWMQPGASFQATGIAREDLFFKRLFDRYGVKADYQQRYEYKNAVNGYLYSDYTAAHRESELSWLGSVYATAMADAASDRGKAPAALQTLFEAGPYLAQDAMTKGLIDHIGQVKDAETAILAKAGDGAKLQAFADYAATDPDEGSGGDVIAVIGAQGAIMTGRGEAPNPLAGGQTVRSDDVSRAFYRAIEDKAVRAIVFRVSSPGGSDTASEQILAAVKAAKAAGKPVIVSMGTYAASGGYWISSAASEIVAQPGTLTGSIGVFGGKFAIGEGLAKFGVDVRGLKVGGDYADAFSPANPMTARQRAGFSAWMDAIYAGFIERVAQGRKLDPARVREIAKGRVWTGAQAIKLGLVDHLGGFYDAVDRAKALAGIKGEARLVSYNTRSSPFEALQQLMGGGADGARTLGVFLGVLSNPEIQAVANELGEGRLRSQGATVLAPRLEP